MHPVPVMGCLARHQLDRRGARLGGHHRVYPLRAVPQVFAAVRGIDRIVERGIGGVLEADVLFDPAGHDAAVAPLPRAAIPGGAVSVSRSHIKIVVLPHDPDRHRLSFRAVAPHRDDLQLVCLADPVELVARPIRHRRNASAKPPVLWPDIGRR